MSEANRQIMKRLFFGIAVAFACVAALVLFFVDPSKVPIYPVCFFHRTTGFNCPGCGSLRAMHALLHGHFLTALHFNAFLVLSLPLFAWVGVRFLRQVIKRDPAPVVRPRWLWVYLGLWMAFGIARELPIHFLASFSP
jgi:hypothetical protein